MLQSLETSPRKFWGEIFILLENIRWEDVDFDVLFLPGIWWEAGLAAGVFEERISIPVIFSGHLGEQKPRVEPLLYVEPVYPHLDLADVGDLLKRSEDGNLDVQVFQLLLGDGREPGVLKGRGFGHLLHRLVQGLDPLDMPDAPSQGALFVNGHEGPPHLF